jgi:hypothetical protein
VSITEIRTPNALVTFEKRALTRTAVIGWGLSHRHTPLPCRQEGDEAGGMSRRDGGGRMVRDGWEASRPQSAPINVRDLLLRHIDERRLR